MINRILIRIKVLQTVYAFYQSGNKDLKVAEQELLFSLKKSYDLYYYLLLLIVKVTDLYRRIVETRKNRYMPSESDLNPNTRLSDNRFAAQVAANETLRKYIAVENISWDNDAGYVQMVLELILDSDIYADYIADPNDSYDTDKEFWHLVFKKIICSNDAIDEYLQDKSIYWNDDIAIIETFLIKTIKQFKERNGSTQPLLPMFKNMDDKSFAVKLFHLSLLKGDEYRRCIEKHLKNWESERIAQLDLLVMQVALAEIMNFPTIPISVTLNEYIDIAKYYSTPKSGLFINGILDTIVNELKKEKLLLKD